MKINRMDWMEWLHKIREDEYLKKRKLSSFERLQSIHEETEEIINKIGLQRSTI